MLSFVLIWVATLILSFVPERFIQPQATRFKSKTIVMQSLLVSLLFLTVSLVVQRPIFSALAVLIFLMIVVAVSNAKFQALKEPMVFSDFAMFSQAFKHPRLYFPFLGLLPVVLAPLIIIGLIYAVLTLEPAMPFTLTRLLTTGLIIAACGYALWQLSQQETLHLIPEQDNARFGLFNSLLIYALQARSKSHRSEIVKTLEKAPFSPKKGLKDKNTHPFSGNFDRFGNITVIQSESFFDARRLHPAIRRELLQNFDATCAQASLHGKLQVPAWGANTMRSEFSFLTGLSYQQMGLYRYYPYQYLDQLPVSSIASALRAQGYYCVCIHPHPAGFFGRDKIFPQLGFDEFIDIGCFEGAAKFGPYISDQAVTDKILEISQQISDQPLFIFAITMENHGPLHLEKITPSQAGEFYDDNKQQHSLRQHSDLSIYLRHLQNADKMIQQLTDFYHDERADVSHTLCFYGDHVPSMPAVYNALQYQDDSSDYFIWHSDKNNHTATPAQNIKIHQLGQLLFKQAFSK